MDISLNQLRVFLTVARKCNFTKAAEELYLSQPAVSAQIHSLERVTKVKLFEQLGKRVFLTEAGQKFLGYAEDMIELTQELEKVLDDLRETPSGTLRLAASSTISIHLLPPILTSFRSERSNVQVLLKVCSPDEVAQGVLHNTWDLGLVASCGGRQDLQHPDLDISDLLTEQMVLITGPNHPWTNRRRVMVEELAGQPFVVYNRGTDIRRLIDEEIARHGVTLDVVMETNSTEVVKHAVENGLGISIVNRYSASEAAAHSNALSILEVEGANLPYSIHLITHRSKYQTATIRAFRAHLRSLASSVGDKPSPLYTVSFR